MTQLPKDKLEALGTQLIRDYDNSEAFKKALLENPIKVMKAVGFDTYTATDSELQIFFMDNQNLFEEAWDEVHVRSIFGCAACKIGVVVIAVLLLVALAKLAVVAGVTIGAGGVQIMATLTEWAATIGMTAGQLQGALAIIKSITLYTILDAICKLLGFCS